MKKHKSGTSKTRQLTKSIKSGKSVKTKKEKLPPVIKIAVIGAGPIGSILGAYLARTKHHVTMIDVIKERLETIRKTGITVAGVVNFQTNISNTTHKISDLKKLSPDYIFICVKAAALVDILKAVKSAAAKNTVVISFQNGLDVEQAVSDVLGKGRVLRAVINYAGNILEQGQIMMSFFNSPNYIGGLSAESNHLAEQTAKLLTETGLTTKFTSDIKKYTWEKTILNSTLAPVCGLTHLKMNEAMALPQTKTLVQEILKEGIAVAKANGYDFSKKFYSEGLEYLNKTGPHKPSMLIDIEAHNATEINYMNGKIAEYGRVKNIPTPYNQTLATLVQGLEKSFISAAAIKKEKQAEAKAEEPKPAPAPAARPGFGPPVRWENAKSQKERQQSSFNRGGSSYEMPPRDKTLSPEPAATPPAKKSHPKPAKPSKSKVKAPTKKKALVRAR